MNNLHFIDITILFLYAAILVGIGRVAVILYLWSKAFLEVGKNGFVRDTQRDATTDEPRSTYYRWRKKFRRLGRESLVDRKP